MYSSDHDPWRLTDDHDVPWERECSWLVDGHGLDSRLVVQAWVDGRLVESRTGSVSGTRWQRWADEFDDAARPRHPVAPPTPPHVAVLDWLDRVVGGRAALLALTDDPGPAPAEAGGDLAVEVGHHLERVCATFFDDDLRAACQRALLALGSERERLTAGLTTNEVAAALLWNVGRANHAFTGGVTQQAVQRELWTRKQLSACGRRLQQHLAGVSISQAHRPHQCPPLEPYANPDLLTPATRRLVMLWRDAALADARE
ncbi:MAG: hypothetical protein LT071_13885 [Nocardioides sp.]|nr:hypothetical protein [Nocardioides sp.]